MLRHKLVAWETAIGEVWDDQQSHAKLVHELYLPFLASEGYGFGDVIKAWYGDSTISMRTISDIPAEAKRLLGDPRFRSMVEADYLYKQHLTQEFDVAIAAVDEILAEIEKSRR